MLAMFRELNATGITIILVTHDPKVAAAANRTIRVADGLIVEDHANPNVIEAPPTAATTPSPDPESQDFQVTDQVTDSDEEDEGGGLAVQTVRRTTVQQHTHKPAGL